MGGYSKLDTTPSSSSIETHLNMNSEFEFEPFLNYHIKCNMAMDILIYQV